MTPLLQLEQVEAGYGPFRALFGVSFSVPEGSVTALMGPNGAGKTTVARVCSALVRPTAGRVTFAGTDVTRSRAWRLARMGLVHLAEGRSVFGSLSVEENLRLVFGATLAPEESEAALARAYEAFPRLAERHTQAAATLSGGEQRMLALARVLSSPPRMLVADELSLGLAPFIVDSVYEALARIRELGTTILLVEQHVQRALDIADEVVLLRKGQVAYAGTAASARERVEELLPDAGHLTTGP